MREKYIYVLLLTENILLIEIYDHIPFNQIIYPGGMEEIV